MLIFVLIIYKPFSRESTSGHSAHRSWCPRPLIVCLLSTLSIIGEFVCWPVACLNSELLHQFHFEICRVFSRQKLKISTEIYLPLLLVLYLVFFAVYLLSLFIHKYKCICIIFHFMIIEYFVTTLRMWNIFRLFFCQIFAVRRNVFIFLSKVEFLVESLENVEQK